METVSNSIEDALISGLSYKLDSTASYITERKSCTYYAMGGNAYAPNSGTKVIKLVINGDSWLDPSTVKIQFDLQNLSGTIPLRTLSGPWSMFRRLRVLCSGQLIEDIDLYSHCHQMFDVLQSEHVRNNEETEGFGVRYDSRASKALIKHPVEVGSGSIIDMPFLSNYVSVAAGDTKTVCFTPLSGIISQGKMIPIRYCPLTFELEVCDNLYDPIISPGDPRWSPGDVAAGFGANNSFSSAWQIINPVIKCDVCRMDN